MNEILLTACNFRADIRGGESYLIMQQYPLNHHLNRHRLLKFIFLLQKKKENALQITRNQQKNISFLCLLIYLDKGSNKKGDSITIRHRDLESIGNRKKNFSKVNKVSDSIK